MWLRGALPHVRNHRYSTPNFQVSVPETPSVQVLLHISIAMWWFSAVLSTANAWKSCLCWVPLQPCFPSLAGDGSNHLPLPRFGDKAEAEQTCRYLCFNLYLQIELSQFLSAWISPSYQRDYNWLPKQYNPCRTPSNLSGGFCKWPKNRVKSLLWDW